MKYAYAFLAALLLVGTSAFPLGFNDNDEPSDLDRDLLEFAKLLPPKEIERIMHDHARDPEVWQTILYLLSDNYHQLVYAAEDLPEFHKYVLYLQAAGYNAIRELRDVHKSLGMKEYVPPKQGPNEMMENLKKGGGINAILDELLAILPRKEIQALHAKKTKESPAFLKFRNAVVSPKFSEIRVALYSQKAMQSVIQDSKAHGFDVQKYYNFRYQLLGFSA